MKLIRGRQHRHRLYVRQMEEVGIQTVCLKSSNVSIQPRRRRPPPPQARAPPYFVHAHTLTQHNFTCTRSTPRYPQQLAHRDHLKMARTKHVPRVSSYSPASIGIVRTALSITTKKQMLHTDITDTYIKTHSIVAPCTHPGMKRIFRL